MENFRINPLIIEELQHEISSFQADDGEFKTYAIDENKDSFYIGKSPFLTAHIACILSEVNSDKFFDPILSKITHFINTLDNSGLGLFKFWYGKANKTAFVNLPFDLDDTAIVNQFLFLQKKPVVNFNILQNNTNSKGEIETWWKPSLSIWIKNIPHTLSFIKHFLSYPIFFLRKEGKAMANYKDSELIVRLNVYTLLEMGKARYKVEDKVFPIKHDAVKKQLLDSIHYGNESVYYYHLCRYHFYSKHLDKTQLKQLENELLACVKQWEAIPSKAGDLFLLFLSLSYLRPLNQHELELVTKLYNSKTWKKQPILFCIGNKEYQNYHQYYSIALTYAVILNLFMKNRH